MAEKEWKYQTVIDWITGEISEGRLVPGDKLMSEEQMCKKFGLSRQTVRRATNELVEKSVLTRLQGSGTYVGNVKPRNRKERFMNIAVMSTFHETYIFPSTLRGVEKTLSREGYMLQIAFTDNRIRNERMILQSLLEKNNIDGLIVEPSKGALPNPNIEFYQEFSSRNVPVLFFNDVYAGLDLPCVRIDDYKISYKATKLLIESGHKKISGIFKLDDGQGRRRYKGYLDAMLEAGLPADAAHVVWYDANMMIESFEAYLFYRLKGSTAVVCYNDQIAFQVINHAAKKGMRVPDDLSVVGIDDSDFARICRVPFTSFPHPKERLGEKVAENLLHLIDNPAYDADYLFDSDVVIRNSIRKIGV